MRLMEKREVEMMRVKGIICIYQGIYTNAFTICYEGNSSLTCLHPSLPNKQIFYSFLNSYLSLKIFGRKTKVLIRCWQ